MAHSSASWFLRQGDPVRVRWAGWESDTVTLGRHGWRLAVNEHPYRRALELVLFHEHGDVVAGGEIADYDRIIDQRFHTAMSYVDRRDRLVVDLAYMNFRRNVTHMSYSEPLASAYWVDTRPSIQQFDPMRSYSMADLGLFRAIQAPVQQELIVDPESVQSMLDQILKLQGPMRKEIRARDQRRERENPAPRQIHAQIVSLREAA